MDSIEIGDYTNQEVGGLICIALLEMLLLLYLSSIILASID
jgi:hypothetical protein